MYGQPLFVTESGTEGGDESHSDSHVPGPSTRAEQSTIPHLSGRSRAILKEYFNEATPVRFPVGHNTIALTEPQMYHLLRILTDETLRRSFTTMERMVIDAVRGAPTALPDRTAHFQIRGRSQTPMRTGTRDSSASETESEGPSTPSSHRRVPADSNEESSFYGESDSATEMELIAQTFSKGSNRTANEPGQGLSSSQPQQPESNSPESSGQDTTLFEMKERAQASTESTETSSRTKKRKGNRRLTRRGLPMREEFFAKIGWTRSYISGPADPVHNPHMVWCHICKKNFSIKSKGPYEILRHHRTERHLRRDQRWGYEHLKSTDPVTGKVQHRVRGRNGKILSKMELAKELPRFINVELVEIGERFPFYEDYVKGSTTAIVTAESRAKTQLCLVGDFIKTHGDLMILRNLWSRMGSFTNHQGAITDFDWGEERLTVGAIPHTQIPFHHTGH